MSLSQKMRAIFNAKVDSGSIRYFGLPTAVLAVVTGNPGAYSQIFTAAAAPQVDYWLCGFQAAVQMSGDGAGTLNASHELCLGKGGTDGAAIAPATLLLTQYPIALAAMANAVDGTFYPVQWLPYPIKVEAATRLAVRIDNDPTNTEDIDEFRVILATVVGERGR